MSADPARVHKIVLDGDLTVGSISAAHKKLSLAFAGANDVRVELQGATQTDLTLVQLLLSARSTAKRTGKTMSLTQPLPDRLMTDLTRGGFVDYADNFWTKGE